MKLSENLKRIRKDNNLSQEQLAEKLGVSRQAVSKWESGQSYPEMDKVLLICKLFNYNLDELMNENIKEVDETKQSKININKYVDDFFNFITKTIDMFSVMKFRQRIKCLIEQFIIGVILFIVFIILGAIGSSILSGLLGGLYYAIHSFCASIYIVFSLIAGVTIMLHIFKIRYLDYYEIVKDENENENQTENNTEKVDEERYDEKRKVFIEKKKEKIIIRDPNHSQSKFLNGLFRIMLAFIKFVAICIAACFVFTFIALFCILVLSFMFVKTGLVFFGALFAIISGIIVNFIILELFYNFIISKKSKKSRMVISFVVALILAGLSIGMILIGITQFNYIPGPNEKNTVEDVYEYEMTEKLSLNSWNCMLNFIETDSDKIKIVVQHSEYMKTKINNNEHIQTIEVYCITDETKIMETFRNVVEDINNKEIVDYSVPVMNVYASKENIEKMKQNEMTKYETSIERELDRFNQENQELQNEIIELEDKLVEKDDEIEELKTQIQDLQVEMDSNDLIIVE